MLVRFALERILYRLSQSAYTDHFLLKGALLVLPIGQFIQLIAGATPTRRRLAQHSMRQQFIDVTQGCVRRALGNGCPFATVELALKAIQQAIEQFHLL